ncbi:hypothetical protein JYU34_012379 [Plutella xylostella]|uniref:Uncharacterized protein n=1 Tax=Plutella xylostella TaxID=51655 RepID=A0ABQ7QB82_PLUXY|nr:hypothetical protein JYU34_012379 [Plutella xylostella]
MADLVYNRADISASSAIFTVERFKAVQVTHAYKHLDLVWCLPRVSKRRAWARVLLPLLSCTTALVCLTAAVFLSVAAAFNKIEVRKCEERAPKLSVLQTCAVFLGQPVRWARAGGVLDRLLALWLWFCLVLRIVYQGELVRSLERGAPPPRVPTLARALQLVDQYGGADSVATFYRNTTILKKFKVLRLEEVHPMLVDIGKGRRFLLAVDLWSVLQSGAAVAVVGERVARAPVGVLARARWAGAGALRAAAARAVGAGLYRRLVADYTWRHLLHVAPVADLTYSALTLHHLSGCFFILLIAAFMCFLVFLAEILWFHFKQKARKKNSGHVFLPFVH